MPRGGTFFKALCRPTVEQTCGRPAMCETGTVPEMVRRLDLPLLSRDGSIIWGSYAMALPTGYRNETPASRRDATGIQWYSVDRLQTDGQGPPSLEVPQHTKPKQGESGIVVAWVGGVPALSPTVWERESREQRRQQDGQCTRARGSSSRQRSGLLGEAVTVENGPRTREGGESRQGTPLLFAVRGRG